MKLIRRLITLVIVLVLVLVIGFIAVNKYVEQTYGISLTRTIKELKILTDEVDTNKLLTNAYDDSDMVDVQTIVNKSADGLITYNEDGSYAVNFDDLPEEMTEVIELSDRQVAAMSQTVVDQELGGRVMAGDNSIGVQICQVAFTKSESGNTLINTVFSLDLGELLNKIPDNFPFNLIKSRIPKVFYVSSTTESIKGTEAFSYSVKHVDLTINNLSGEDTEDLFHTLDLLVGIGSAESLNETLGDMMMDALVGDEDARGVAHQLESIGSTDYEFVEENGEIYYRVLRDLPDLGEPDQND